MNSKELVYRAIERQGPSRVPVNYCNRDFDCSDTLSVGYGPAAGFDPAGSELNEWGFSWRTLNDTMGQPHHRPLADWGRIEAYIPPDPRAPGRLHEAQQLVANKPDKFLKFGLGISGFNLATFLRGFESLLSDLCLAPHRAERVLDMVFAFENALIEQLAGIPVDAVAFGDDWGTQQGLMIAPGLWREVFKPRYAAQFAQVHRLGKKVWFHTCGNVYAILGDLVEIGVDVLELLQPDLLGVERLATEFGGHVCFCCSVDHQRRAISGTRDEIRAYARYLQDSLGRSGGGFIAYVEDYSSLGMSEQNYQWIREAFHSLPPYAQESGECS